MTFSHESASQLRIGELARSAGVTSRAVRHYHATGLLREPPRDAAGYRRYGPADLVRLVHICQLRALGMPIEQIATVLEDSEASGGDLPATLRTLATDVDAQIDRLRGVHDRLMTLAGSEDLDDAGDVLTAGLMARGLLDPTPAPDVPVAPAPPASKVQPAAAPTVIDLASGLRNEASSAADFGELLQRFRTVTDEGVEDLAQQFAAAIPTQAHQASPVDLRMVDQLLDDRLTPAQRSCMARLRTLLGRLEHPAVVRAGARGRRGQ